LTPDAIHARIQTRGFKAEGVTGVGEADEQGAYTTLKIKADSAKFGELTHLLESDDEVKLAEPFPRFTKIGKAVAEDLVWKAIIALLLASAAMLIYIGVRFHGFEYGLAAVVAMVHDTLLTIAALAVVDHLGWVDGKINLTMIAALLTIIGYSVNDTIVIFDRVRENLALPNRPPRLDAIIDLSNNEMLPRTLLTGGASLLALLALYIVGGGVLQGFTFAMIFGIIVGTYSSVFVACPFVAFWTRKFRSTEG
jgi:preprotein translocase SecF subunit